MAGFACSCGGGSRSTPQSTPTTPERPRGKARTGGVAIGENPKASQLAALADRTGKHQGVERGGVKVKNPNYWRRDSEHGAMARARERAVGNRRHTSLKPRDRKR